MFVDRKEVALALALMPVLAGCSSKEKPVASISTLPTSIPVTETATPNPTDTPKPTEPPRTPTPESSPAPTVEKLPNSMPVYGSFIGQSIDESGAKTSDILLTRLPSNRIMTRINEAGGCKLTPTFNLTSQDLTNPQEIRKGTVDMSITLKGTTLSGQLNFKEFSLGGRTCGGTKSKYEAALKHTDLDLLIRDLTSMIQATGQEPTRDFVITMLQSNNGGPLPELSK